MEGEQTELDKTIIEAIKDPLTHLVRNAVDHGIETPARRRTLGKPDEGVISLRAFHEGGQVNIEMADDGGGIDVDAIRRKAVERGLLTADQASRLGDRDALGLIFLPGLSTAERVTKVSGRGVGMDVVKTNIEKIGGSVDVQSRPDAGTTFKIKIPLTLAIIPALIVTTGGDRYAIPQVNLLELVRLEGERAATSIERIHGAPVYRLRGQLLPLVYLGEALGLAAREYWRAAATVDFATLRRQHLQWIDRLREFLAGRLALEVATLKSATECDLGRWMTAWAETPLARLSQYGDLDLAHRAFHESVRRVVDAGQRSSSREAEAHMPAMEQASRTVVAELNRWEHSAAALTAISIVVLQAGDQPFGLVVDDVSDTEEIVVKPLGKQLKSVTAFAGATIMGDGRVALILDTLALAQRAGVVADARDAGLGEKTAQARGRDVQESLLLFEGPDGGALGITLSQVARLEEFPQSAVERAGGREVVQYRGAIMPLVRVGALLPGREPRPGSGDADRLQVIVSENGDGAVGLVIGRILDTVEATLCPTRNGDTPGVLGTQVLRGRVTELLDLAALLHTAATGAGRHQ
jgi:two-component system chemotaxis sensor kinase CheA